jgi:RimJ/RimL family protein N-acetyltransferase
MVQLAELRAEVLESNAASRRVLEKLGFRFQHLIPDFDKVDGVSVNGCLYALRRPAGGS